MVPWAHLSHPQIDISRLDQLIRFLHAHECDQQTHTGRDHATPSVAVDHIYVIAMHAMRPKNKERNIAVAVANWVLAQTTHVVGLKNQILHEGRLSG